MRSVTLAVAAALLALSADAKHISERMNHKLQQNAWPNIKYYYTYKMSFSLYRWDGWTLSPYQNA